MKPKKPKRERQDFDALMKKARKFNAGMSEVDREVGYQAPEDGTPFMLCRTAMSAIRCGIECGDWNNVAEGYAMLEDLEKRLPPVAR